MYVSPPCLSGISKKAIRQDDKPIEQQPLTLFWGYLKLVYCGRSLVSWFYLSALTGILILGNLKPARPLMFFW